MNLLRMLPTWAPYAGLALGLVLMVAGVLWRGAAPVEWGYWFGFAKNSTLPGKGLYLLGGLLVVSTVGVMIRGGVRARRVRACAPSTRPVRIVAWEDSGLLRIRVGRHKEVLCLFRPTFDDEDATEDARGFFPAGGRLCAAPRGRAAKVYQVAEGERVKRCLLYLGRRSLSAALAARQKSAARSEGDDEDGDDDGDDDIE